MGALSRGGASREVCTAVPALCPPRRLLDVRGAGTYLRLSRASLQTLETMLARKYGSGAA
jgi:hypothetical protein